MYQAFDVCKHTAIDELSCADWKLKEVPRNGNKMSNLVEVFEQLIMFGMASWPSSEVR